MAWLMAACEPSDPGVVIQLDTSAVTIEGRVHDVCLAGVGATDSIRPAEIAARPGDAVRFTADRRPHALAFVADALAPEVREFLERTGQLRGPPLVNEGAHWVVLLDGAPPGRYPFICRSHGARGILMVSAEE